MSMRKFSLRDGLPDQFRSFEIMQPSLGEGFDLVEDKLGVYGIWIRDGDLVLQRAGLCEGTDTLARMGEFVLFYTGASIGIRSRLLQHFVGNVEQSNFRKSMLALQVHDEALEPYRRFSDLPTAEKWLSEWLDKRAAVTHFNCGNALEVEDHLIRSTFTPINIQGRGRSSFTQHLQAIKANLDSLTWLREGIEAYSPPRRYRR